MNKFQSVRKVVNISGLKKILPEISEKIESWYKSHFWLADYTYTKACCCMPR